MPGASFLTRYLVNDLTVPTGTLASAPLVQPWDLGNVELVELAVVIPSGHAGLTGFAVEYATMRVLPFSDGDDWIISDDEDITFAIDMEVGKPVDLVGFNEDIYDHIFHLRAKIRSLDAEGYGPGAGVAFVPV